MEQKICVLIIDNEHESIQRISEHLQECEMISKIKGAQSIEQALYKIIEQIPDLIILQHPLPGSESTDFIKFMKLKFPETTLTVCSGAKSDAAFAIRNGIFNFLLKPILQKPLLGLIEKVYLEKTNNTDQKIKELIEKSAEDKRLLIQTPKGYILVDQDDIIYCLSEGVYTELHLTQNRKEIVYMLISRVEELLDPEKFIRSSRKHIINKKYIRKVIKSQNSIVLSYQGNEFLMKASKQHIKELTRLNSD